MLASASASLIASVIPNGINVGEVHQRSFLDEGVACFTAPSSIFDEPDTAAKPLQGCFDGESIWSASELRIFRLGWSWEALLRRVVLEAVLDLLSDSTVPKTTIDGSGKHHSRQGLVLDRGLRGEPMPKIYHSPSLSAYDQIAEAVQGPPNAQQTSEFFRM